MGCQSTPPKRRVFRFHAPILRRSLDPYRYQLSCQRMQSDAGSVTSESTWWKLYINMAACTLGSLVKAFHEERQSCWSVTNLRSTRQTTCELMCLCSFRPCSCQYSVSGHCLFRKWTTKKCSTHCQSSNGLWKRCIRWQCLQDMPHMTIQNTACL